MDAEKTVVLITGANSGIGYDTTVRLASSSAKFHVVLCSRSVERGQEALSQIHSTNSDLKGTISLLQLDVTDKQSVLSAAEKVAQDYGRVDVLINNAGIVYLEGDLLNRLRTTFETNTFGPALVTETFVPLIQKSSAPRVIYVSSDQGSITLRADPSYQYYSLRANEYRMSKAALNMLAMCHQFDFKDWGCKVCAYNPGFVVTNLSGKGEEKRKGRADRGARPSTISADCLYEIVEGRKDEYLNGLVDVDGGTHPW